MLQTQPNVTRIGHLRLLIVLALTCSWVSADDRIWKDATGKFSVTADLLTLDKEFVVLETQRGQLIAVRRDELSSGDQEYVTTVEKERAPSNASAPKSADAPPAKGGRPDDNSTWHLSDGQVVKGRLIGFGTQTMKVKRERGKVHVNDRKWDELPSAYRKIIPDVVSRIDKKPIQSLEELEEHLAELGGGPIDYKVEGIQLDLASWGTITIPVSLLTLDEATQVKPALDRWRASQDAKVSTSDRAEMSRRERTILNSQERYRQKKTRYDRQVKMLQLKLLAVDAGVTDMWEVLVYPPNGYGYPNTVVVYARNSLSASQQVVRKYPGWRVGGVAKISY